MVATAPGNNSSDLTDFGANDWLIEEMVEAYSSDPNSVDPAWRAFFAARAASVPVALFFTVAGSPLA